MMGKFQCKWICKWQDILMVDFSCYELVITSGEYEVNRRKAFKYVYAAAINIASDGQWLWWADA